MKKGGQVTIFIIIGIIIVGAIILFFLFRESLGITIGESPAKNPNSFLESCLEDKIQEGVDKLLMQGGYIEPVLYKNFKFENEKDPVKISYLCYTQANYVPCINLKPMLIKHLQNELNDSIYDDVGNCFNSLTSSLEKQGYDVDARYNGFDLNLDEDKIVVNINSEIILTKTGETTTQENFEIHVLSKIYDLAFVIQEIVNKESANCEFNHYDSFNYPEFDINKDTTSDSSIIYRIKYRESNDEFRFAVRGCVIPSGFGLKIE